MYILYSAHGMTRGFVRFREVSRVRYRSADLSAAFPNFSQKKFIITCNGWIGRCLIPDIGSALVLFAQVSWFRVEAGKRVAVSSSNRIGNVVSGSRFILRFKDVRDSDLGVYACRAVNDLGKADATVEMSGKSGENLNILTISFIPE